jgi:4-hydroxy-2-oxoheptanedioate aldolase
MNELLRQDGRSREADGALLKRRLADGESLLGVWIETGSAVNAEILAGLGFDFLLIDLEHGQGDVGDAIAMLRAGANAPCVVRVPSADPTFLKRILDAGASALMVPSVESAAEAEAVVQACRYPPRGRRGYAASAVRASGYGVDVGYMRRAHDDLLLIVQIESAAAVARAAEICAVDGVDAPFLGVNDMAGSIGCLEELDHPDVRVLVREAQAAMRASGKPMGTVPRTGAGWRDLLESGYQFIPFASDVGLLREGGLALLQERRRATPVKTAPAREPGPSAKPPGVRTAVAPPERRDRP